MKIFTILAILIPLQAMALNFSSGKVANDELASYTVETGVDTLNGKTMRLTQITTDTVIKKDIDTILADTQRIEETCNIDLAHKRDLLEKSAPCPIRNKQTIEAFAVKDLNHCPNRGLNCKLVRRLVYNNIKIEVTYLQYELSYYYYDGNDIKIVIEYLDPTELKQVAGMKYKHNPPIGYFKNVTTLRAIDDDTTAVHVETLNGIENFLLYLGFLDSIFIEEGLKAMQATVSDLHTNAKNE